MAAKRTTRSSVLSNNEILGGKDEGVLDYGDETSSLVMRRTRSSSVVRRMTRFLAAVGTTSSLAEMWRRCSLAAMRTP